MLYELLAEHPLGLSSPVHTTEQTDDERWQVLWAFVFSGFSPCTRTLQRSGPSPAFGLSDQTSF
jgi:hypothetical protein